MIGKIPLLVRTVKHLKPVQVFYQVYNRLKSKPVLTAFSVKTKHHPGAELLKFQLRFSADKALTINNSFTFLNLEHSFYDKIDWNYQAYGKLWNYNLQYFNFLHQEDIANQKKQNLLKDIGLWLKEGKLPLEPYPVSLRVMNTIRYISVEDVNDPVINGDLLAQLTYLSKNLEYHLLGNHLLENAFALFMGAHVFNSTPWREKAKSILYQQLKEQVLNDGGHFELSPMYHQIILFRLIELVDWYRDVLNKDDLFLAFVTKKASEMLSWLTNITFNNGDIPHFNDSATGIAFTSHQLFGFAHQLGIKANDKLMLAGSGYRKFSFNAYECVVDVGAIGPSYQPGHSHADALSFVLYSKDLPIIVDVGTSTYQIGDKRNFERSTNAHNTVEIGCANQSEVWGGFRVGRRAEVTILEDTKNRLSASHNGYRSKFAAKHQRSFSFEDNRIHIDDIIYTDSNPLCGALFHFHPDCRIQIEGKDKVLINDIATIIFTNATEVYMQEYELANGYNRYLMAVCLAVSFNKTLNTVIAF